MSKSLLLALVCVCVCVASIAALPTLEEYRMLFGNWALKHQKTYGPAERTRRLGIWMKNYEFVEAHNKQAAAGKHSFTLGMNHLADLTNEEYRAKYLKYQRTSERANTTFTAIHESALPTTVDWRTKGVVTDVKDQGQCGSCWSFSATGSMEGAHALKTGTLLSFSEQELVDCVNNGQYTCDTGGVMQDGFQYAIDNGMETEDEYPYCGVDCENEQCAFDSSQVQATFSSYQNIPSGSESGLQSATATQPGVAVAIDASSNEFQLYSGGVFNLPSCSSTELDHGVLVVGYGTQNGTPYWLVKNSWSASWGLSGYIMMSRNKDNQCGIATDASYALV